MQKCYFLLTKAAVTESFTFLISHKNDTYDELKENNVHYLVFLYSLVSTNIIVLYFLVVATNEHRLRMFIGNIRGTAPPDIFIS
jgi:hypothetical protein